VTVTSDMSSLWRRFAMRTSRLDTLAVLKTLITIYWRDSDDQCSCNCPVWTEVKLIRPLR
jgi:hypothetical protein